MLQDPLTIPLTSASVFDKANNPISVCANVAATDFGQGSSVRVGVIPASVLGSDTPFTLKMSHSTSKENAPFTTARTLVRLDATRINAETGKPVVLSAYAVVALPQGIDWSASEASVLLRCLGTLLAFGNQPSPSSTILGMTNSSFTQRLIDGEA